MDDETDMEEEEVDFGGAGGMRMSQESGNAGGSPALLHSDLHPPHDGGGAGGQMQQPVVDYGQDSAATQLSDGQMTSPLAGQARAAAQAGGFCPVSDGSLGRAGSQPTVPEGPGSQDQHLLHQYLHLASAAIMRPHVTTNGGAGGGGISGSPGCTGNDQVSSQVRGSSPTGSTDAGVGASAAGSSCAVPALPMKTASGAEGEQAGLALALGLPSVDHDEGMQASAAVTALGASTSTAQAMQQAAALVAQPRKPRCQFFTTYRV
jgi:hypothetical protein